MKEYQIAHAIVPEKGIQARSLERESGSVVSPKASQVRSEQVIHEQVSLTQHRGTPYAKDGGTIYMSDTKNYDAAPQGNGDAPVGDGSVEQALANMFAAQREEATPSHQSPTATNGRTVLADIITHPTKEMANPTLKEFADNFNEDREKNPLSDEKKWSTDKLKETYRELHKLNRSPLSKLKDRLGLQSSEDLTSQQHQEVDIQPYTRLIIHELNRRGENIGVLIQEVAAAAERTESKRTKPLDKEHPVSRLLNGDRRTNLSEVETWQNANDDREARLEKAREYLSQVPGYDALSDEEKSRQEDAILRAHDVGYGDIGKNGKDAGVFNFTRQQLREKAQILDEGGVTDPRVRRALMEAGIVGTGDAGGPDMGEGPDAAFGSPDGGDPNGDDQWVSSHVINPNLTLGQDVIPTHRPDPSFAGESRHPERMQEWLTAWRRENGDAEIPPNVLNAMRQAVLNNQRPSGGFNETRLPNEGIYLTPRQQAEQARRQGESVRIPVSSTGQEMPGLLDSDDYERLAREMYERGRQANPDNPMNQDPPQEQRGGKKEKHTRLKPREREYTYGDEKKITSAEALAEEIMRFDDPELWGTEGIEGIPENGKYPLLEKFYENGKVKTVMARQKDGTIKEVEVYKLNEENFLRWVRDKMMYWHDDSPDEAHDFGQKVQLIRDFGSVSLKSMVDQASRYFRSEATGEIMEGLVNEIKRESWLFGASRATDIDYRQVMGSDEDLPKKIVQLFYGNTFTKTVWGGKSALYWIMNLPEKFRDTGKEIDGDSKVGRALNLAYHVYYNISDKEKLIELLGPNTGLLNANTIETTLRKLAEDDEIDFDKEFYVDPEDLDAIKKDPDKLMDFINIFNQNGKPTRIIRAVRSIIQEEIAHKFQLYVIDEKTGQVAIDEKTGKPVIDSTNIRYADTFAMSMMRWTGGASRNDVGAQGYDAWTRVQVTDEYRKKQPVKSRGGAFGNPYNINLLKQLGTDFLSGTTVQNMERFDGTGKELVPKTTLQVMEEMQKYADDPEKYQNVASQLVFAENTMRGFALDHLGRAFTIFQQLQGAEEIKLDKFTHYDTINGLTFDRAGFEEALKEKFFKPMRYGYSTYGQINFGKVIRSAYNTKENGKKVIRYKDMRLAEAMFGRQIIDGLGHDFYNHGTDDIKMDDPDWDKKINWEKVNSKEGKQKIWRQVALARIAAELYAHRDYHSTDPKYNWAYYHSVIEALELLPDNIAGNELDLRSSKATGHFFDHHDIEWLREASNTTFGSLFRQQLIKDVFAGSVEGLKKGLKEWFKATMKV